jgi:hypothetical protein
MKYQTSSSYTLVRKITITKLFDELHGLPPAMVSHYWFIEEEGDEPSLLVSSATYLQSLRGNKKITLMVLDEERAEFID